LALALYLLLVLCVHGMGVVGEVDASWTRGPPPRVVVDLAGGAPTWSDPTLEPHAGHAFGPLVASQTRPTERLQLGPVALPLAVNSYTGGPPDWPARVVHGLTGSRHAVLALHLLLGAGLLVAVGAFTRRFGRADVPGVAMLLLATDWCFLFFRRVLGGTELLLLAAGLLLLWGLMSRRAGGGRGDLAIAAAIGLGLLAKITFLPTVIAFAIAALLTRWDRPADASGARPRWLLGGAIVLGLTAPLWVAALHALALPDSPRVVSHDGLGLQLSRLGHGLQGLLEGGGGAAREMPASLGYFFLEPLRWFAPALGAESVSWGWAPLRLLGWLVAAWGVALGWAGKPWRDVTRDPQASLLRFLSLAAPLQILLLWLANRDLHHLAQAAPTVALLVGLACERIACRYSEQRTPKRALLALVLCLPLVMAGGASALRTHAVIRTVPAPALTEHGQRSLEGLIDRCEVQRLWTADYDLYGVFEQRRPSLELSHAWGAVSASRDRDALLVDLLRAARGSHLLLVRPAAVRIYDLAPDHDELLEAARLAGVDAVLVGEIEGESWARLYRVSGP